MDKVIAGYYIGQHVQFDVTHRRLSCLDPKNRSLIKEYRMRDTMMRLFLFLLQNANGKVVLKKDILYHVWDSHGLKSSHQRLWQVMQSLQFRLLSLHVPGDFILTKQTIEGKGILLNGEIIKPYYFHINNLT
ncbi:hypothetical protein EH228_10800 [Erwinia endophytica]|uniref:winged helix-turn-helix domain-containing protein n=1 Tax=Erwinia endophytica TaxID=1563158 RepID=UPI001266047F|nr:hypothetical protein [Erwinia endophytica]KAB8310372.1 hypothetical protein EH228_10800 [Erwinia endophytica]